MAREFSRKFYKSKSWLSCREYIFNKYDGICGKCGAPGEEVHHKTFLRPSNIDDPDIALGEDNLILLCKDCHFKEHENTNPKFNNKRKRVVENGCFFDDYGDLVQQEVNIVYGAPGSGKSTYVSNNMKDGDLVVDLDNIKCAISLMSKTEVPDELVSVALELRECVYELINAKKIDCERIWVVASLPRIEERQALTRRLNAKLIYCESTVHQCIERAMNDIDRLDKDKQIKIIDSWFANYEK